MANPTHHLTDPQAFIRLLLDNACPLTEKENGIKVFYIETHCVAWTVEAVKTLAAGWTVLTMRSEPC